MEHYLFQMLLRRYHSHLRVRVPACSRALPLPLCGDFLKWGGKGKEGRGSVTYQPCGAVIVQSLIPSQLCNNSNVKVGDDTRD